MSPIAAAIVDGVRVTLLRQPRGNPARAGAGSFVGSLIFYLLVELVSSFLQSDAPRMFVGWGLSTLLADASLTLIAAWLLVRMSGRHSITWGVAAITLAATAAISVLVHWPLQEAAFAFYENGHDWTAAALAWLSEFWWLFVLVTLARWLRPRRLALAIFAGMLAFAVSAMPWWWIPAAPLVMHDVSASQAVDAADLGEQDYIGGSGFEDAEDDEFIAFDPEQLMFDQPAMIESAINSLRPRTPGKINLYVVAFAGDGSENVFRNEVEYAERLFSQRFDAEGHILVLENNPASVDTRPLATLLNLRLALAAIAQRMDPAEDILLVYLTSHGSAEHELHVALEPLPLNQIAPEDLAEAMQTTPSMRWKVLVVNACYSGGFIDSLRDDSTMVITAARSDRTSFGCGSASEITYFGKAFLSEALNTTTSMTEAFALATTSITQWEAEEKLEAHSEPQISTSRSIEAKLDAWRMTLPVTPSVPFAPAANELP